MGKPIHRVPGSDRLPSSAKGEEELGLGSGPGPAPQALDLAPQHPQGVPIRGILPNEALPQTDEAWA